jgi:hypothetical protein
MLVMALLSPTMKMLSHAVDDVAGATGLRHDVDAESCS